MSISKIRVKSAVIKNNEKNVTATKTTAPFKGTTNAIAITSSTTTTISATTITTTSITTTALETSTFTTQGSPRNYDQNRAKILPSWPSSSTTSTNKPVKTLNTPTLAATTTSSSTLQSTTAPTTILPQTNLLKIEAYIPSLTNRPQKTIRRSYSTLSNTTLRKHMIQHVNKNQVNHHLEIQHRNSQTKIIASNEENYGKTSLQSVINAMPKVLKQPATLRKRPTLKGPIKRQRSKSRSSSNSNSSRPITAGVAVNATPSSSDTACTSTYSAVIIQQPNGICRIQRSAREQEKLQDRINYDKRGLTAIPIFENETNLRLLSLQHNLINTFHIPKEQRKEEKNETKIIMETVTREQINGLPVKNTELNILGNQTQQHPHHFYRNKQRLPLAVAKPNVEQLQPQAPILGQLMSALNTQHTSSVSNPMTFGNYILQRKSINMNNCQILKNRKSNLQHSTHLRLGMRKSKSFISNLNLQLSLNKRTVSNQKTNLLRQHKGIANLNSFDSSASNLTTDSTQSTLLTTEVEDPLIGEQEGLEGEDKHSNSYLPLAIKNKQLNISYGNIFQSLVFLDLYDNQIERISNLDGLPALTVLLLGKNRIYDISGLSSLKSTLRVLDLHGNKLCSISNKINCLSELKSLNLAGNQIRQINHNDFFGLHNLKELNLKRNKLKRINGFQHLTALERLWLCHNDLHKVDDMSSIAKAENLIEITIENNPLTLAGDCVSFLVSYLPKLQTLSQMPITEQVRKAAMTWRTNKELSEANSNLSNNEIFNIIRREEIISNARTNWELLRSQQMVKNSLKQQKANKNNIELEKITETNENNYEEFIKLPPIENQQQATVDTNTEVEERFSSASSLGPNVHTSSSCYSSQDEDIELTNSKTNGQPSHTDKPSLKSQQQMENIINHTLSMNSNLKHHSSQLQPSKCNQTTTIKTPTSTMTTTTNCTPTLNLQFPMETNKVLGNQQNQAVITTTVTTSVLSLISLTQTTTTATISSSLSASSSSMAVATPVSTFSKRYMTGSLMRSQTIVDTVTCAGGTGTDGGYTNGYTVKTNTVTTMNNIRFQSKLNSNATTQTAVITTLQQTTTTTTAVAITMTMIASETTTSYSIAPAITSNTNNNGLITSFMNGDNISLTLNTTKTTASGAFNSITSIAAPHTTPATIAIGPCSATSTKLTTIEREREQGGDYLIEICGRYLNIYGQGALRFIDKQWNPTKANDVNTLNFSYINFNNIALILGRIKVRFVHAENFVFRETNISSLGQLNALAELQGIASLIIDDEGNPITSKNLWREYAIYRLSHWGLKTLNNLEITEQEIEKSNSIYAGLSDLILWSMPDAMLQPLLARLRLDESCSASKLQPKEWLKEPDNKSLRLVVGKEALQWKKSNNQEAQQLPTPQQIRHLQNQYFCIDSSAFSNTSLTVAATTVMCPNSPAALISSNVNLTARERGKIHFTLMMENTCNAVEKLHKLERIWPTILLNIIRNTLLDYSQLDVYIRNLMAEIMK